MKVLPDLFRGRIVPGALLGLYMILTPLSTPASESDMHKITENLPWDFEVIPALAGADRVTVTILRSRDPVDNTGSDETHLEIQYHGATYTDREAADSDFEQILPANPDTTGLWHVAVQSGTRIHWLNGQCVISTEQFRHLYAGLITQAEDGGSRANRAILCRCGAPCQQVNIDR